MFYVKNVPGWERAFRVVMGVGLLVAALLHFGSTPMGWLAGGAGAMAMMSGLMGFCPPCALVGRRI
jgi:hypothetical protein